jgi:hypothetical protein
MFRNVGQRDFIIELSVNRDFIKVDLKDWIIYLKFCFILWGTALETQEMLKKYFASNAKGRTQNVIGFLESNIWKLGLKTVRVQVSTPTIIEKKTWKQKNLNRRRMYDIQYVAC